MKEILFFSEILLKLTLSINQINLSTIEAHFNILSIS